MILHRITPQQYLMGREVTEPITETMWREMATLLFRVNSLIAELPAGVIPKEGNLVSSGYRPPSINARAGGALRSGHLLCQAVDLFDPSNAIDDYLAKDQTLLVRHNLWLESPAKTIGWSHFDTKPRASRIFKP